MAHAMTIRISNLFVAAAQHVIRGVSAENSFIKKPPARSGRVVVCPSARSALLAVVRHVAPACDARDRAHHLLLRLLLRMVPIVLSS